MNTVINYVTEGVTGYLGWWANAAKSAYNYAESWVVTPPPAKPPKRKPAKRAAKKAPARKTA